MFRVVDAVHEAVVDRIVARARAGDAAALAEIYDLYAGRVYRFVLPRLRRSSDAEDLLQRVFLKMIEALPRYEARGMPFKAWLFRIARNAVIDYERTRHDHASLDDVFDLSDAQLGPAELAESAAEMDAVRAALDLLTPEQRDVIVYRFFAGLSPREIGLLMDKREGTIRALQFRAMQTLRRSLAPRIELAGAEGAGA